MTGVSFGYGTGSVMTAAQWAALFAQCYPAGNVSTYSATLLAGSTQAAWFTALGLPSAAPGFANGLATLDGTGKVPVAQLPASVVGALEYQGTWNAAINAPALSSGTGTKGFYYKVSTAGATSIDGNNVWNVGDIIAFDGTTWDRIVGSMTSAEIITLLGYTPVNLSTLVLAQIQGVVVSGFNGSGVPLVTSSPVGFRNRIINGDMRIDQRNAGASQTIVANAALAYTVDRFYAYCTGGNTSGQRVSGSAPDQFLYQFTGAVGITAIGFGQRIEATNSFDLAGTTAMLSVKLANSLLVTVTWAAYYANSTDTFGTLASPTKTLIATGSFTVNSTPTRYFVPISIPGAATTGVEVVFSVGGQVAGTWQIGEVQLEPGSYATAFERRPYGVELAQAQRYYETGSVFYNSTGASATCGATYAFIVVKRSSPTVTFLGITYSSANSLANQTSYLATPSTAFAYNFFSITAGYVNFTFTASAEL